MIFFDNTKILIDEYYYNSIIFWDTHKHYVYDFHLVNKCNNKKFNKRYEFYKKFFYEYVEKANASKQKKKEKTTKEKFKPLGLDDDDEDEGEQEERKNIDQKSKTNREKNKVNFSF